MSVASPGRIVRRAATLHGELHLPSDKSIAHRALLFNALADGSATVRTGDVGEDVRSTIRCLRALGVAVDESAPGVFEVGGMVRQPAEPLDCGNSGTTMRLLAGVLGGLPLTATLIGDGSLSQRPMRRVATPLIAMGAEVRSTDGHAPLTVRGNARLEALEHRLQVPSAQLIGAISLAALAADGVTRIVSPGPTRDHTERLLRWMGIDISRRGDVTSVRGPARPSARSVTVPADPSAATPWLVAAAIHPDADLLMRGVGLNPTRLAAVDVLREMGARIEVRETATDGPEPIGEIRVRSSGQLRAIELHGPRVAELIDELPALATAMAAADGTSILRDAAELRVKESDRIATTVAGLAAIGARVEELPDGWRVARGVARDASVQTRGDHRLAIAFAVAAATGVAGEVAIDDAACASVSYPAFWDDLDRASRADAA
jgi:3-phosphoshikimate 1-carboxyvinyltransferase